jgi:hypothetical protein
MQPITDLSAFSTWHPGVLSLTVYAFIVAGLMVVLWALTEWLGQRRQAPWLGRLAADLFLHLRAAFGVGLYLA